MAAVVHEIATWPEDRLRVAFPGMSEFKRIGAGGFAVVFSTVHVEHGPVALKVIVGEDRWQATPAGQAEFRASVQREITSMSQLASQGNIVLLYDSGVSTTGLPYLLMQLCEFGSVAAQLGKRLDKGEGAFPASQVANIGASVARGLASAHAAGLMHLDVKPGNILVDEYYAYRLSDFGIAQFLNSVRNEGQMWFITPHFAAPEMWGDAKPCFASDVFSLGATLFQLATGRRAFDHVLDPSTGDTENQMRLHDAIRGEDRRRLDEFGLSPALADVVDECLSAEPDRRPTAAKLERRLRDLSVNHDDDLTVEWVPKTTDRVDIRIDPDPVPVPTPDPDPGPAPGPAPGPDPRDPTDPNIKTVDDEHEKRRRLPMVLAALLGAVVAAAIAVAVVLIVRDQHAAPLSDAALRPGVPGLDPPSSPPATPGSLPAQPGTLTVTDQAGGKVKLSWDVASPVDGVDYVVLAATFSVDPTTGRPTNTPTQRGLLGEDRAIGGPTTPVLRLSHDARSLEVPVDVAVHTCFRVVAVDEATATPSSDRVCAPGAKPVAPGLGQVVVDGTGATATVSWVDQSDDESGFVVIGVVERERVQRVVSVTPAPADSRQLVVPHIAGACYTVRADNALDPLPLGAAIGTTLPTSSNQSPGMCDASGR